MNTEIVLRLESSFRQEDTEQLFERALAAVVEDIQDIKQMMKEMTGPLARALDTVLGGVQDIKQQLESLTAPSPTTLLDLGHLPAPAPIVSDVRDVKKMVETFIQQSGNRGENPK